MLKGTTFYGLATLAGLDPGSASLLTSGACQSCAEFLIGSPFMQKLDAGGPAVRGVTYTLIATEHDELVVPYTNGLVTAPNVTDLVVQEQCPLDASDHISIVADPVTGQDVLNALDPAHRRPVPCTFVAPVVG